MLVAFLDRLCAIGHGDQERVARFLFRGFFAAFDQVDNFRLVAGIRRDDLEQHLQCRELLRNRGVMVSRAGFEPATLCLKGRCSTD